MKTPTFMSRIRKVAWLDIRGLIVTVVLWGLFIAFLYTLTLPGGIWHEP
jgi:hypothetical protein